MTSKFYLRMMMAAMALLFAAVGCKDSSDGDTPPPTGKYTFSIAVDGVTATEASVKVTPDKAEAVYYCSVIKKSRFDEFKSDADYLKDDIEYLKSQAKAQNVSFEAYLKTVVNTGSQPVKFVSLEPSTDYYAYVYGISTAGEVTSDLKKLAFMTEQGTEPEPEGLDFEFVVENITTTAADVSVIPSNDEDTYYFDVQSAAAFKGMSEAEIDAYIISQVDAEYLTKGPDGYPAELFDQLAPLTPGTDYYVFAVGYDAEKAEATTKPKMYKFTTEAPSGNAPDLTLAAQPGDAYGKNTATKIYCSALSLATVSGTYTCLPKKTVDDMIGQGASLGEIADANGKAMSEQFLGYLTQEPGVGLTLSELQPSTAYTVIFNVRSAGGMSTAKRADVTTTAETGPVVPSNMTFKVDVTNIGEKTATVKITPSNNQETYFFDVQRKALIDENFADDASLVAALDATYAQSGGISNLLSKDVETYDAAKLLPGTEYYVLVFGYTTGATTPVLRQKFATETGSQSDLKLSVNIDASAATIPGGISASITASNEDDYMFDFILADEIEGASDADIVSYVEEKYGDIIGWLLESGNYQTEPTDFGGNLALMPGADYYLVAFGYDGETSTTGVVKAKFKAGAGPSASGMVFGFEVSDLTATEATVSVSASIEPVPYMWNIISESDYKSVGGNADAIAKIVKADFDYYAAAFTPRQIIAGLGAWYSGAEYSYSDMDPGTAYVAYAVCVDLEGKIVGTPAVSAPFTTPAASGSSAGLNKQQRTIPGFGYRVFDQKQADAVQSEVKRRAAQTIAPLAMQSKKGVTLFARAKAGQIEQSLVIGQISAVSKNEVRSLKSAAKMSPKQLRVRTPRL